MNYRKPQKKGGKYSQRQSEVQFLYEEAMIEK